MQNVRPANSKDIDFIYSSLKEDLEEQGVLHRFNYSKESFKSMIFCEQPIAYFLILIIEGEPAGFVNYAIDNRNFTVNNPSKNLYINDLFVRKEYRRKKGATLLMEEIKKIAVVEGCGRIEGFVLANNSISLSFYRDYLKAEIISEDLHCMRIRVSPTV
ncbi:N-acetyltransferase ats1 [Legionella birminghamensis]|uniref:N-acetyltransferase ats1 n=1 Tax=Legionella birminghamensis TaxID=28083 RepID=A0A378ID32_9GAMM|nr:GNAT family N-acetyltransferase [Legionella birminghamensis]KTC66764.1 N-acetyltransferase ats1 [Legionella birminghamensis]STX32913.1 N-acetyltransferase ats1 [Legionella birminghamensis]